MDESAILDAVRAKYDLLRPLMDERMRRQWAASEAMSAQEGQPVEGPFAAALGRL